MTCYFRPSTWPQPTSAYELVICVRSSGSMPPPVYKYVEHFRMVYLNPWDISYVAQEEIHVAHVIYHLKPSNVARASVICQLHTCRRKSNLELGCNTRYPTRPDLSTRRLMLEKFRSTKDIYNFPECYQHKSLQRTSRATYLNNHSPYAFISATMGQNGHQGSLFNLIPRHFCLCTMVTEDIWP
jgi:hypothetical protein